MKHNAIANRSGKMDRGLPFRLGLVFLLLNGLGSLTAAPGDTKWVFATGGAVNSAPAIGAGGTVYIGSSDGKVYALEGATGDKRWDFPTGGAVDCSPAVGIDGTVYVGSADGKMYALDGLAGFKKWEFETPKPGGSTGPFPVGVSSPAIGPDGTVYFGGMDGKFFAVDGANGAQKWEALAASFDVCLAPAIGADGTVYVVRGDWMTNQLYALDNATGAQKWSLALGLETYVAPAIGADGIVYAGSSLTLMALEGATGNRRWESPVGGYTYSLFSSPAVGADGTLYVSTGYNYLGRLDGHVYALDGATGTNKWAFRTGQTSRSSPALGSDGTVYVGADEGNFYALDGATGVRKWGIQTGGSAGSPAVGADGTVYVGSGDGKVYALAGGAGLAPSPWPKFRGDARNTGSRQHLGPPRVMAPPTNALVGVGVPFALEAMAEGAQPLSYTWFFNGAPLSGATNSVLSFASFDATNAGLYRVRVTNALGSVECPDISLLAGGQIAVEVVGPGKVQRTPAASLLPLGTVVELTAQPDAGRPFRGWSGDVKDTNLVLRCTVGRSVRLRATFGYQPGELKWVFQPGGDRPFSGGESGSPAMGADGTLYVYSETIRFRSVYAVDGTTGAKKWEARIGGEGSVSSLVGPDGTVYVNWNMGGFCALDGATGNTRWTAAASAGAAIGPDGTLFINGGEGVFHADNGKIYAFDGAGGQKKWEFAAPIGTVSIGADGTLYVGFNSAGLYALNPTNGGTNWVFAAGGQLTSPAIGSDGTLFCGSTDKKAYAVNGRDGSKKWECSLAAPTWSPPVLGTDGTVYVATSDQDATWDGSPDDSSFYALEGLTGKVKWEFSTGGSFYTTPAVSAEGTVYVSGTPNKLYAVDAGTGGRKWEFTTGTVRASAPTIGADGTVYVTQNGTVWAVQGDAGLARSAWPKFQGDAQNTGAHRLPGAPRILTQTPSQMVKEGLPFTLEVVTDGQQPQTSEWYYNGTRLPEAAGSFLHFAAFSRTNAGTYRVRVSNALGSVDSPDIIVAAGTEITVDVIGPGQVTRSPLGTLQPLGTSIELVAQPDDGQWFLGWTGDLEDTNRVLRFTASRSLRLQAAFSSPPGTLKWTFRPGGQPSSSIVENGSPAIGPDGTVYFSQTFGKLYAVDGQTGTKKWEAAVRTRSSVVVGDDGTVYVPSDMDALRAFDGATGNLKWTGPGHFTIMLGSDGTVFGTSMPGALYANSGINALDGATGQLKWSFPSDELRAAAPLTMGADGTLYFVYFNFYAMDSTNGKHKWVYPIGGVPPTTSPALGADGTLFIGEDNKLVALQGTDGAKKWQSALDGTVSAAPSLGTDGTVFVGTTAGTLYALDPVTGNQVWASPTAGGISVPPAVSAGGTVYVTCSNNRLLAVDAKTGGKKWEYTSSDAMSSAPAIGADGTVYVAANCILWAFQGDQGLAESPWPKFQGNARNTGSHIFAGPPHIVTQTPSQMASIGRPFSLEVLTEGIRPQVFAWYFNGVRLNDMLEPSLAFASFDPTNAGTYQVRVTNALGRVESQEMRITAGGQLTVEIVGPGQVTGLPAASILPLGTPIELQAQPQDGRRFLGWSGDVQSPSPTLHLTMESSLRLRAAFETRPGELLWSWSAGGTGMQEFCPAIGSDGTVYGAGNGHVFALDGLTGTKKWETGIYATAGYSSPEISFDGTLYISSDDGNLYALDARTGTILRQFPSPFAWKTYNSSGAFSIGVDGTIYLSSPTNNVFALDGKSGRLKWAFPTQQPVNYPPVIGSDNTVFSFEIGNGRGYPLGFVRLFALNGETGALKWAFTNNSLSLVLALGADDTVYVSSSSGKIFALDSALGTLKWSCSVGASFGSSVSIGEDGTLFATANDGKIYAFKGTSGVKVWELLTGDRVAPTPTIGSDGTVYTAAAGTLYALDGASGTEQWKYRVPASGSSGARMSPPALGAQGILYLWCQGVFYAIQGNSGLANSPWPKFLGNARNNGNGWLFAAAPKLVVPPHQMIDELATLRVTNTVAGLDPATNSLSFALLAAPPGVQLEPATGILTWTPDETQGPGNYELTVMVSNSVAPFLMLTNHFTVAVGEVNRAPVLTVPPAQIFDEFATLMVTNTATDADLPANTLTFGLVSGPAGVQLDPHSGVLTWTPTAGLGPSTNSVVVKVTDNGIPSLSDTNQFRVVVQAVNRALTFVPMADQIVNELATLTATNRVSDASIPLSRLSYDVVAAPAGVVLDRASGVLRWTPTEVQGPSTNAISVKVFYKDEPFLSATQSFQVRVNEVNQAPHLTTAIRDLTVYGGQKLVFTNTAADADWPANALAFLLDSDAPTGAQLDRITGVFRWTAPAVTAPQTDRFTVWVTDNGEPWKSDSGKFSVVTLPAPAELRLLNVQWAAPGVMRISWAAVPGTRYQLQSTERLEAPAWASTGDILTAAGQTASQSEAIGIHAQRYYRVLRLGD